MASSAATRARLRITRAGLTTIPGAAEHLLEATRFAWYSWGFRDGSVLIYRNGALRPEYADLTPTQASRLRWKAYNPD